MKSKTKKPKATPVEIVQSTMRIDRPLWERVKLIGIRQRRSMNDIVVLALEAYCEREERS